MAGNIVELRKMRRYALQNAAQIAATPSNQAMQSDLPAQMGFNDGAPRMPMQAFGVSVGTNARQALQTNPNRGYLYVQNNSMDDLYVSFDQTPTALTGLTIGPGGYYEPRVVPTNSVWIASASLTNAQVSIVEGTLR